MALAIAAGTMLSGIVGARADEATGQWSGAVELQGNYYYERSTRVVAPTVGGEVTAPTGWRMRGRYLLDAITSASLATGVVSDVAFTEIRHEGTVGAGKAVRLGIGELQLDGQLRASKEPDYLSLSGSMQAALAMNRRQSVLSSGLTYVHDDVGKVLRGLNPDGSNQRDIGQVGELDGIVLNLAWEQILTPVLSVQGGYDLGILQGFLQNAYRQVAVLGALRPETHPDQRRRHTLFARLSAYLEPSGSALHLSLRSYLDSWGIVAFNPELRVYQELGEWLQLRARYRFYWQDEASFYAPPEQYTSEDLYVTADPKMSRFHSHLGGLQLLVSLGFLRATWLRFFEDARLDFNFDRLWNTNRFGNGIIAQAGLRLPIR